MDTAIVNSPGIEKKPNKADNGRPLATFRSFVMGEVKGARHFHQVDKNEKYGNLIYPIDEAAEQDLLDGELNGVCYEVFPIEEIMVKDANPKVFKIFTPGTLNDILLLDDDDFKEATELINANAEEVLKVVKGKPGKKATGKKVETVIKEQPKFTYQTATMDELKAEISALGGVYKDKDTKQVLWTNYNALVISSKRVNPNDGDAGGSADPLG